jgi:hypothetical protein
METLVDNADTPEQSVLHSDRSMQLRSCITQLSSDHREVIDLVYYHDKSVDEVAVAASTATRRTPTRSGRAGAACRSGSVLESWTGKTAKTSRAIILARHHRRRERPTTPGRSRPAVTARLGASSPGVRF